MPLQNRVGPDGEIVAVAARGDMMGNRGGRLHTPERALGTRRWASRAWIACRLSFNDRHRTVMAPNSYTELFFLDEATALAAGHRPCYECRRADARAFAAAWQDGHSLAAPPRAGDMDRVLQADRVAADGGKRTYPSALGVVPAGAIIAIEGVAFLVTDNGLRQWSFGGYAPAIPRPSEDMTVDVLTPACIAAVLASGYRPILHASAA